MALLRKLPAEAVVRVGVDDLAALHRPMDQAVSQVVRSQFRQHFAVSFCRIMMGLELGWTHYNLCGQDIAGINQLMLFDRILNISQMPEDQF